MPIITNGQNFFNNWKLAVDGLREAANANKELESLCSYLGRLLSEVCQTNFASGDPTSARFALEYAAKSRGFVRVGALDTVVTINGARFTLLATKVYCADQSECQQMIGQDDTLTNATISDFLADGILESFYS